MTIQEKLLITALKMPKKYFNIHSERILQKIPRRDIEDYARWELDMIEEDEANEHCDCMDITKQDNDDLLSELESRGLKLQGDNLITSDLVHRFCKIAELENPIKLQSIIEQLEKDNNL